MNIIKIHCLLPLALFATSNAAIAESCRIEKHATLPITFDGYIPTVPVSINGHQLNIGIDTGAQSTIISQEVAEQFSLPLTYHDYANVRGSDGDRKARSAMIQSLVIGRDEYRGKTAMVLSLLQPSSKQSDLRTGTPLTGLIGADILSRYDIEYDAPAHTFSLYRPHNCSHVVPPWHGRFIGVRIDLATTQCILLPVALNHRQLHAIFDTGANLTSLALMSAEWLGITDEVLARDPQSHITGTAGAVRPSPLHTFDSFQIGHDQFNHPRIRVVDFPAAEADMLLGEDYMRTRRFWLSYTTHMLFIQAGSSNP